MLKYTFNFLGALSLSSTLVFTTKQRQKQKQEIEKKAIDFAEIQSNLTKTLKSYPHQKSTQIQIFFYEYQLLRI